MYQQSQFFDALKDWSSHVSRNSIEDPKFRKKRYCNRLGRVFKLKDCDGCEGHNLRKA